MTSQVSDVLLDLSPAFDMIDQMFSYKETSMLLELKKLSYSSDGFRFVCTCDESSSHTLVSHGVPQGSVFRMILSTLWMLQL